MDITRHINERNTAPNNTLLYLELGVRIITGLLLMIKGFYFVSHSAQLETIIRQATSMSQANLLVIYIGFAHLFGGAFIILGLLTRFAVVLQIPIMLGAVYYNIGTNTLASPGEVMLSLVVLILLIYVMIKGSGKISMDDYRKRKQL